MINVLKYIKIITYKQMITNNNMLYKRLNKILTIKNKILINYAVERHVIQMLHRLIKNLFKIS